MLITGKIYFTCVPFGREIEDFVAFLTRGAVLEEAIKQGYLSFDKDNDKQMLGAYLVI